MEVISNDMIIDISLVLAFFIFGMSVVEWKSNKQDN